MDLPPRLETLLRHDGEAPDAFRVRIERHLAARAAIGWQLQARQDHGDRSVDLVFVHPPLGQPLASRSR